MDGRVLNMRDSLLVCVRIALIYCLFMLPGRIRGLPQVATQKQYCAFESFNATCRLDEVILMESAQYGRMRLGRCVKKIIGKEYVGCAKDVLSVLDEKCSGRRHCVVSVAAQELRDTNPCPGEVTWHLEASYTCVKVRTSGGQICQHGGGSGINSPSVVRQQYGYLSSDVAVKSRFGSEQCPWSIRMSSGQRVKLTLLHFREPKFDTWQGDRCIRYGSAQDGNQKQSLTVCGADIHKRSIPVYESEGNDVIVKLETHEDNNFLLRYEAVGCAMPTLPIAMWSQRRGNDITVKCNSTGNTWHLVCKDNEWIGSFGNCSSGKSKSDTYYTSLPGDSTFPYSVLIAVGVGVALGVILGGICLLIVSSYLKRHDCPERNLNMAIGIDDMYEEKRYLGAELAVEPAAEWITLGGDCPACDPDPARHKPPHGIVRLSRPESDPAPQRCPANKTFIYERAAMS